MSNNHGKQLKGSRLSHEIAMKMNPSFHLKAISLWNHGNYQRMADLNYLRSHSEKGHPLGEAKDQIVLQILQKLIKIILRGRNVQNKTNLLTHQQKEAECANPHIFPYAHAHLSCVQLMTLCPGT